MRHEFDQEQARALGTGLMKIRHHVEAVSNVLLSRWTRARALSAAVATHSGRSNPGSTYDILGTARKYETFIRDGRVNGND